MTVESLGVPCSLVITEPFVAIRDRMAEMLGVPGYPATVLPHPLSIRDRPWLRAEAERLAGEIVARLTTE